jgi:hypothetical protein
MVVCALLPQAVSKSKLASPIFAVVVSALFAAIAVLSTVNYVAYIRWTGKYPFYFLFNRSGTRGDKGGNSSADK